MDEPTHDYHPAEQNVAPVEQPQAATAGETVPPQDAPPVIPVTANPAPASATSDKTVSDDYMDRASFKELLQMVGAMLFVGLLSAAGWHAAHYSGAWPY